MPGYSGTPLPKKLGIKDGYRVALIGMPAQVRTELRGALAKCRVAKAAAAPLDFISLFSKSRAELERDVKRAAEALAPAGMLWISWPKKSSKVPTDITEDIIREVALPLGFVDIKVCAVSEVWSALKLVVRKELR